MAKPVEDRRAEEGRPAPNGRSSLSARSKKPLPDTREEADFLYRPKNPRDAVRPSWGQRLCMMNRLGLFHPEGRPITNQEAHEALLGAIYGEDLAVAVHESPS